MRKLTEEAKKAIRRSFYQKIDRTLSTQHQARVYADLACDIMETEENDPSNLKGWWAEEWESTEVCGYTTEASRWCDLPDGHDGEHNARGPR